MQRPAEKYLVQRIASFLKSRDPAAGLHRILNAGAGQSISIEQQLSNNGCNYICDRIDIEDCRVPYSTVGDCWQCPVDDMKPVKSCSYASVLSNYVLEHVENIREASREIYRVLAPGGLFAATVPNTLAMEIVLSRHTPLWFHTMVRRERSWDTKYAYGSIPELLGIFVDSGFVVEEEKRWSFLEGYLWKYPLVAGFARLYDRMVNASGNQRLMADVYIALRKPS